PVTPVAGGAGVIAPIGVFHLDHVRALIRQDHRRVRARDHRGQVNDAIPVQRARYGVLHDWFSPAARNDAVPLQVYNDVLLLDRHRDRLRDVGSLYDGLPRRHFNRIAAHRDPAGIAEALTGADVELPPMPGAADDLTLAGILILPRFVRLDQSRQDAFAHRSALVRAAVKQAKELAAKIEHRDRSAAHRHQLALARWDLRNGGNNVLAHDRGVSCKPLLSVGRG